MVAATVSTDESVVFLTYIRYVLEMLGQAKLDTTTIYTHETIDKLKEIHTATHPSARLKKPEG
jgi:integrase/recombinase XerD